VQIWTVVPGVLSADPRLVPDAREVPQLGFEEAQELAHFGAKVLHPRTIRPAVALEIPVRILSTFAPHEPGTRVTRESSSDELKAVTIMKDLILLTVVWAWSEASTLTGAFDEAHRWSQQALSRAAVSTYQGLMGALVGSTGRLLPPLWQRLQTLM
jgi:aspartate kinase